MELLGQKTLKEIFPIEVDEETLDEIGTLLASGESLDDEIIDEAIDSLEEGK
jgi:hypothetical protein